MSSLFKRNKKDSISELLEGGNTVRVQVTFENAILVKKDSPDKVKSLEIKIPARDEPSESVKPKKSKTSGIEFNLSAHNVIFDVTYDKNRPVEFELEIMHKNKGLISIAKFDLRMTDLLSRKSIRREVPPTYDKLHKIKLNYRVSRSNSMREKSQVPTKNQPRKESTIEMGDLNPQKTITETPKTSGVGEREKPKVEDLNGQKPSTDASTPSADPKEPRTDPPKTSPNAPKPSTDSPKTSDNAQKSGTDASKSSDGDGEGEGEGKLTLSLISPYTAGWQKVKEKVKSGNMKQQKPSFRPESCILVNTTVSSFLEHYVYQTDSFPLDVLG